MNLQSPTLMVYGNPWKTRVPSDELTDNSLLNSLLYCNVLRRSRVIALKLFAYMYCEEM